MFVIFCSRSTGVSNLANRQPQAASSKLFADTSPRTPAWLRGGVLFFMLCLHGPLVADEAPVAPDTPVGAASAALDSQEPDSTKPDTAKLVDQLHREIEAMRRELKVPGLAVAVVKDDQVLLCRGYGHLQQDGDQKVNQDTLFAIASNTKAFTATALAILVDEGKLQWDDPVQQYLPWLRLRDPLATAELRVRDLLCHRSGLGTFSGDLVWWGTDYSPRQVLERARQLEPASSFRSAYGYSNLMFLAAGLVIEQVSGMPYADFIQQRILTPADMHRTVVSVRDLLAKANYATPHKSGPGTSAPIPWMNWDTMAAAGGLISSAADMSNWLRIQLRGGTLASGDPLFSAARARDMWTSHTPIRVSESYQDRFPSTHFRSYGLGWSMSDYRGLKLVGHGGGYDGMYSRVLLVPEKNLGVVVLTNSMTSLPPALAHHLVDRVLWGDTSRSWSQDAKEDFLSGLKTRAERVAKATTAVAPDTSPSHSLQDYAGTYRCPLYGDIVVSKTDDGLAIAFTPNADLVADLEHLHYDTFVMRWREEYAWFDAGTVTFQADAQGRFQTLDFDVPNDDLWFYELQPVRVAE